MEGVIAAQLEKCGDTIFKLNGIDLDGWDGEFIASSQLSQLRRDVLTLLRDRRLVVAAERERDVFKENLDAKYIDREVAGDVGITNQLSETFYRDHGVRVIAPQLELARDLSGETVMRSSYCIRRQIGECLREGSKLKDPLFIEQGGNRYQLHFECKQCRMRITKMSRDDKQHNTQI